MVGNLEEWVLDSWRGAEGMLEGGAVHLYLLCGLFGRYSRQPDYRSTDRRVFGGFGASVRLFDHNWTPMQAIIAQSQVHDPSLNTTFPTRLSSIQDTS